MKLQSSLLAAGLLLAFAFPPLGHGQPAGEARSAAGKVRVLVVVGGHDFQTNDFFQVFQENPDITYETVAHPAAPAWLTPEAAKSYDVLILYDMWQDISDEAKTNLLNRLKDGKGLVALHHSIASYQDWSEYAKIIGGHYYLEDRVVNGVQKRRSTYQHDVDFRVHVSVPRHPVTDGLADFDIHDETYGLFDPDPGVHSLLTTDAPTSARTLAWAKRYSAARVVYIQLGHDRSAYNNPNYRRLVAQAIRWTAKKGR